MDIDVFKALFAAALGIIAWFLKGLIAEVKNEVKALELKVATNSTNIEVLKSDHSNLGSKIDEMGKDLREISLYIRNLKQVQ